MYPYKTYRSRLKIRFTKTNTQTTHQETADKAETVLNGPKTTK